MLMLASSAVPACVIAALGISLIVLLSLGRLQDLR